MPYARRSALGIAPVIVAAAIPAVENLFSSIFGGHSQALEAGVADAVQGWLTIATQNLAQIATPGTPGYNAFTHMRCAGGDQSVNAASQSPLIAGPFPVPPGCGYAHQDSRNYARSAVLTVAATAIAQGIPVPATYTFGNDSPAGTTTTMSATSGMSITSGGTSAPGSTLPINVGGGYTVGVPVPTSSLLNATIGGIPVLGVAAVGVALAFALGGSHGRRR
ncbi:MAG TPA: hypothetical protein VH374_26290 [Polyangia bacterium]|jgi:hypothetical protein|nr:hypothetical protein [Polyangia bacterium]